MPPVAEQFDQMQQRVETVRELLDFQRRLAEQRKTERDELLAMLREFAAGSQTWSPAQPDVVTVTATVHRSTAAALLELSQR